MYRQSEKYVKQQYLLNMSSQYGELRLTITAEIGWLVWGISASFNGCRVTSLLHGRRSTTLCTMFGRLLGWYTIYTFWGLLPPNGILPGAKFTLRLSLAFSYIGSVTVQNSSSQQWASAKHCGLQQKAPPIFDMAAITFGIGPHSSLK